MGSVENILACEAKECGIQKVGQRWSVHSQLNKKKRETNK
jgi:hypothetical protein